jgi:hypothetical protein
MTHFLTDLETEVQHQHESATQLITAATALAVSRQAQQPSSLSSSAPKPPVKKHPSQFCQNGHNPEATGHTIENCHQIHPEKAVEYHKGVIAKLKAQGFNQALLSVNSKIANTIVLDTGASGHYLKHKEYVTSFTPMTLSVYSANGDAISILGFGEAIIHASTGPIILKEAFFSPKLSNLLISLCIFFSRLLHHCLSRW